MANKERVIEALSEAQRELESGELAPEELAEIRTRVDEIARFVEQSSATSDDSSRDPVVGGAVEYAPVDNGNVGEDRTQ